jgi:hypothetical protein
LILHRERVDAADSSDTAGMMARMGFVQQIVYRDRLAAVVIGEEAVIEDGLSGVELLDVQAMCLFAIEVASGERPGPYSDRRAAAFAVQARAQRAIVSSLRGESG